jgi:endoglucanase
MRIRMVLLLVVALGACSNSARAPADAGAADRSAGGGGGVGSGGVGGQTVGSGGAIGTGGALGTGGTIGTGGSPAGSGGMSDAGADVSSDLRDGAGRDTSSADANPAGDPAANFRCGNWADQRDNFVNGNLQLSGLSSATDTYATVLSKSGAILSGFQALAGANTVRIPINEPTVLGAWWSAYKGSIDAGTARGMKVIIAYWAWHNGRMDDVTVFDTMWDAVVTAYVGNPRVYFQIFNEPFGYTGPALIDLAAQWIGRHPDVPKGRIIVAGTGYDGDVRQQGADARLNGTLLSLHIYPFSNAAQTSVAGWKSMLQTNLGAFGARTIVTEWGAPMTRGADYSVPGEGNNNGSFVTAMSQYLHDNQMGSCYWPVLRTADTWSLTTIAATGTNPSLTVTNASGLARITAAFNQ